MNIGDHTPDVGFTTGDRQEIRLADFKGKQNVVIAFYARAFTGG
jgi:peroxiredoxin